MRAFYWVASIVVWIGFMVALNVWAVKHGSPQHVWLYCDLLGWCR